MVCFDDDDMAACRVERPDLTVEVRAVDRFKRLANIILCRIFAEADFHILPGFTVNLIFA